MFENLNTVAENTSLQFRLATLADVDAIVRLVQSAYRGDSGRRGWTTESELLDGQRIDATGVIDVINKQDSCVLLALCEAQIVACAHVEKQGEICYFGMFAVNPALQGGGTGKQILNQAQRIASEVYRCDRMRMTVISVRDDLIAWYERRGYCRTGVFTPFPYGDERFGIPKRDDLRFERLEMQLS